LVSIVFGVVYSSHGLKDLRRIQNQIEQTKIRVAQLELENQNLKRQVGLFEKPSDIIAEREIRDFLGWVKPNEIVYLERLSRP
jgi:cell division protein FtsB